jgi:pyruvate formate lyase activating enzyme
VYIGNIPGHPGENTYCPKCGRVVVARTGYEVTANNIVDGKCRFCGHPIAGLWK